MLVISILALLLTKFSKSEDLYYEASFPPNGESYIELYQFSNSHFTKKEFIKIKLSQTDPEYTNIITKGTVLSIPFSCPNNALSVP